MTNDGVGCALEYECGRWGRHHPPQQSGSGTCERGPDGLLATARVYDDVGRVAEYRSTPIELRLTVYRFLSVRRTGVVSICWKEGSQLLAAR